MDCSIKTVASDDDIYVLEALAKEIWNQHFTPIIGQAQVDYMLERFQSFKAVGRQISDGMNYKMICADNKNVGYCGFKKDGDRIFLSKLYVKLEYRGNGLSRVMLDEVRKFAAENNIKSVYLTVNKRNDDTISIYKHMGFRIIDSVVTDINGGFVMDDFIMQFDFT